MFLKVEEYMFLVSIIHGLGEANTITKLTVIYGIRKLFYYFKSRLSNLSFFLV